MAPLPSSLSKNHAFTLIELLVTIAIIGVLAAIIIPTVNSAMRSADKVTCVTNLRNIGACLLLSAGDNGYFPAGDYTDVANNNKQTNWNNVVAAYLPGNTVAFSAALTKLFYCPAVTVEKQFLVAGTPKPHSYSSNPLVMPITSSTAAKVSTTGARLGALRRPSQIILVMDGPIVAGGNGNASITLSLLSQISGINVAANAEKSVTIPDYSSNPLYPRFRHGSAASASNPDEMNAVFADGSVKGIEYGDLKYRNLSVAY